MDMEIELDGTTYRYIGGQWFDAKTFIKPPDVIIQKLNRRLPGQQSAQKTTRAVRPAARPSRRMGLDFKGLQDHDFQRGTAGTSWRRRSSLGGLLAQQLSDTTPHDFLSYAIYRRAQVYIAIPDWFDEGNKFPAAKLDFRLDETRAQYGFYIEKSDKPMDSTWDWKRLIPALIEDARLVGDVKQAMKQLDLRWSIEIWQKNDLERTVEISEGDPLMWQEGNRQETISWETFLERLATIEPNKWCDVRLCQFMEKGNAMDAGTDIAKQVVDVFQALLPLYESVSKRQLGRRPFPTIRDGDSTFSHDETFPFIVDVIRQEYRRTRTFVTHDEIVDGLLRHPESRDLVIAAHDQQGREKSLEAVAANMVAWFSQRITVHSSDYEGMFERQKIEGKWAYQLAKGEDGPGHSD